MSFATGSLIPEAAKWHKSWQKEVFAQEQDVCASPQNSALGLNTLEEAHYVHVEIASKKDRGPPFL